MPSATSPATCILRVSWNTSRKRAFIRRFSLFATAYSLPIPFWANSAAKRRNSPGWSVGLMNVQFAIKDDTIYILEVNPRASRTVPFVAKATGVPIAKIAARAMAGEKWSIC